MNDQDPTRQGLAADGGLAALQALYAAGTQQWIHAEQMRWTILYNFLVGNTILLLAWTQLFTAFLGNQHSLGVQIVLIGSCAMGFGGGIVWALLEQRANRFSTLYFRAGHDLEEMLARIAGSTRGPFAATHADRPAGLVQTHRVAIAVPLVFAVVYLGLFMVSIYAVGGRL